MPAVWLERQMLEQLAAEVRRMMAFVGQDSAQVPYNRVPDIR